jgi:hypothetical protein
MPYTAGIHNSCGCIHWRGVMTPWSIWRQQAFLQTNFGQFHGVITTGESRLASDEYTGVSKTNMINSMNI